MHVIIQNMLPGKPVGGVEARVEREQTKQGIPIEGTFGLIPQGALELSLMLSCAKTRELSPTLLRLPAVS